MMTSIVLAIASAALFLFNVMVLFLHNFEWFRRLLTFCIVKYIAFIALAIVFIGMPIFLVSIMCIKTKGNTDTYDNQFDKWASRKKS